MSKHYISTVMPSPEPSSVVLLQLAPHNLAIGFHTLDQQDKLG